MEFWKANYFNTTTQISVGTGSVTSENLLNPNKFRQWISDGFDDDNTTTSITISFDQTLAVDRIALRNINLKGLTVFYNGATANTFALTGGGSAHTSTSDWSSNCATSLCLQTAQVNVTSLTFDLKTTQVADSEKAVGYIVISAQELDFDRVPPASGYTPVIVPKQSLLTLSDGGKRLHTVEQKQSVKIKLTHISESFRDDLKAIWEARSEFMFCPFPTSTSWDAFLFQFVWPGNFEFHKFSDNAETSGFSGTIVLDEVTL